MLGDQSNGDQAMGEIGKNSRGPCFLPAPALPKSVRSWLTRQDFDSRVVALLSRGHFKSVCPVAGEGKNYEIAYDSRQICGPFAGLSFGSANPANDRVLSGGPFNQAASTLISISDSPFMAAVNVQGCEVIFLASEDVADLNTER